MANGNIQGSNYVQNPNTGREVYNIVEGRTARNGDITIPSSGTTPTNGMTYLWSFNIDERTGGFTGKSWLLDEVIGSANPLIAYGLTDIDAIINHLEEYGNLNFVFQSWSPSTDEYNTFNAQFGSTGVAAGCSVYNSN